MKGLLIFLALVMTMAMVQADDLLLDVLFTNDIHGGIDSYAATFINPDFPPQLGGGGSAATYIKDVRQMSNGRTRDNFLVDAGDFFQGHPVGTVSKGAYVVEYFNQIGYDLTVVGNHEYDIGEEALMETYSKIKLPVLSCNIVRKGTKELVPYVTPYIIREKMGVKFGIIGVTTTDTQQMSFPENIKNVDFLPAKVELQKYVDLIKDSVDVVIVVGHMGLPYDPQPAYDRRYLSGRTYSGERRWGYDAQELAHEVKGIDVFFGGHMHKGVSKPWEDPDTHTLVIQGWAYGSSIGHITLKIDPVTKTLAGYQLPAIREGALLTLFEDEFLPDAEIASSIAANQAIAEEGMDDIVGEAAMHLSKFGNGAQSLIGNLVCESMLDYADADFAFLNLGGVRGELKMGPISYRDVFNVMPFDNQIVMMEINGAFLKEIIEFRVSGGRHGLRVAGVTVEYSKKRKNFDRVTKLLVGGEPLDPDKIYRVVTTDFLLQGNAGLSMLTKVPEEQVTRYEMNLRDAIVEYIRKNSPVTAKIDNRWVQKD
ncbi:MAG: bifunctional metallophosphatase/5'-nucleotidase [Candidatus Cloacimonetes bacterium]|nr:bifunctional metallophosphatase/5'-nucleotidase [Candidatus Cloacimonadota bacterium]